MKGKKRYQEHPDFKPQGLDEYIAGKSTEYTKKARQLVTEIQRFISKHAFTKLKEEFGEEDKKLWFEGIPGPVRTSK